jgi:hypothetical protein
MGEPSWINLIGQSVAFPIIYPVLAVPPLNRRPSKLNSYEEMANSSLPNINCKLMPQHCTALPYLADEVL